jgi:tetratricopeptide (TPR) repeat protein
MAWFWRKWLPWLRGHFRFFLFLGGLGLVLVVLGYPVAWYGWGIYHYRAGTADLARREFLGAREHWACCLRLWPRDARLHLLAGQTARRAGLFDEAEDHLTQAQRLRGAAEAITLERALIQVQQGNAEATLENQLQTYLDANHPQAVEILEALSQGCARTYRLDAALACLDRWLELEPGVVPALMLRGWVHERLFLFDRALADYEAALEKAPADQAALLRKGQLLLLTKGATPETEEVVTRLWRLRPDDPRVGLLYAQWQNLAGDATGAEQTLRDLVQSFPEEAAPRVEYGKLLLNRGNNKEAEVQLRKAASLVPWDYQTLFALQKFVAQYGKPEEAEALGVRVKQISDDLTRIQELTQALRSTPRNPDLRSEVGEIFLRSGEEREGEVWLWSALQSDPKCRRAHLALAEFYERTGKPDQAVFHRRAAQEAAPTVPTPEPDKPR